MRKLGMVVLAPLFLGTLLISEGWTQPARFLSYRAMFHFKVPLGER